MIWQSANDIHCDIWNVRLRYVELQPETSAQDGVAASLRLEFGKCSVRISAGPTTILMFLIVFIRSSLGKCGDNTSNRPPLLPLKSLQFIIHHQTTGRYTV
jgi:hypothetical protein